MSTRITVDNNFLHYLSDLNESEQYRIIELFRNRFFSFSPQQELALELLEMYSTVMKKEKAKKHLQLFLQISEGSKYFSSWKEIVNTELGLRSEPIFLSNTVGIENEFRAIAQGKSPQGIISHLIEMAKKWKKEDYEADKMYRKKFQDLLKKEGLWASKITFEDFFRLDAVTRDLNELIKEFFRKANKPINDQEADKIRNDKDKYPYLHVSLRVNIARYYRCVLDHNFGVRRGDSFDAYQLIYLTELDYLVSDDEPLKDLARLVFGNVNRVRSFQQFLDSSNEVLTATYKQNESRN